MTEKDKLKIYLSEYEILKYNVSEILFSNNLSYTNQVLLTLLSIAEAEFWVRGTDEKLLVDIYPIFDGGCVVCFTKNKPKTGERGEPLLRKAVLRKSVCILEFLDSENLISAIEMLYKNNRTKTIESSVYLYSNKYRLILPDGFIGHINVPSACAFCTRLITKRIEKAKTVEYGKVICKKKAIEKIGKCFVK